MNSQGAISYLCALKSVLINFILSLNPVTELATKYILMCIYRNTCRHMHTLTELEKKYHQIIRLGSDDMEQCALLL